MPYAKINVSDLTEARKKRFWKKVNKEGPIHSRGENLGRCWIWTGSKSHGYGLFFIFKKPRFAHRVSMMIAGSLDDGLFALHSCNTPACVNPDHLRSGTQFDNMRDMYESGRAALGDKHGSKTRPESVVYADKHPNTRLSSIQVSCIRKIYQQSRLAQKRIAAQFRISQPHLCLILKGRKRSRG